MREEALDVSVEAFDQQGTDDILRMYLHEIGKIPLLTKEQEYDLWLQIYQGKDAQGQLESPDAADFAQHQIEQLANVAAQGQAARNQFIESNLRLVVSIAKRYQSTMPFLDCIQEGNIGLEHAVEKFDARKGFKFSTYATWWINQSIQRAIPNNRAVRLPVHANEGIYFVKKHSDKLKYETGDQAELSRSQLQERFSPEKIVELLEIDRTTQNLASLDKPINETDAQSNVLGDYIPDASLDSVEEEALSNLDTELVYKLLDTPQLLDEKQKTVLSMRFGLDDGEGKTLEAIGIKLGVTRERVRQIQERAIKLLQRYVSVHEVTL